MKENPVSQAKVIALAGGKGGVGTSLLAANLAIYLARQGRELTVIDASPNGPALHADLGLPSPGQSLGRRLSDPDIPLRDLMVAGGIPNVRLLAGIADSHTLPPPPADFFASVVREASRLPCDFVIVDAGSGLSRPVRETCAAADTVFLVTTPEPASLRGALRLQAGILYLVLRAELGDEAAARLERAYAEKGLRGILSDLENDRDARRRVQQAAEKIAFGLLLNQVRTSAEVEAATRMGAVLSMIQAVMLDPVVTLEFDLCALQAAGERRVLSQRYPNAPVVRGLEKVVLPLLTPPRRRRGGKSRERYAPLATWHHYRLLALDPRATPREVQRHYERIRVPFLEDGEAEAVATRPCLDRVVEQVEVAYRTLIFLENRHKYDQQLVETGVLETTDLRDAGPAAHRAAAGGTARAGTTVSNGVEPAATPATGAAPAETAATDAAKGSAEGDPRKGWRPSPGQKRFRGGAETAAGAAASKEEHAAKVPTVKDNGGPDTDPAGHFSGSALKSLRLSRGLEVDRISAITKIRVQHIESIEDEVYDQLPVPVFLRGFLRAYARCLDLDAERVVRDYMESYEAWQRERP